MTSGALDMVKAISDYGIQSVICVWFLYWVYVKEKKNQKRDEKIMDYLMSLQNYSQREEELLNEENKKKERHQAYLKTRKEITPKINLKLHDMVTLFDLNRACIFEFHNSNENLTGFPFAKYSCNFESIKRGIMPIMNCAANIPYSSLGTLLNEFHKSNDDGYVIINDISVLEEQSSPLFRLLQEHDMNHLIFFPLYDINNNSFGFIVTEYQNEIELSQEESAQLKEFVAYFNSILDNNNPIF